MSAQPSGLDTRERHLLQEAAEWRLLALLFECPGPGWQDQIAAISPEIADAELQAAAHHALAEASEGLYHSIFGPGGPAPPREASYQRSVQLGYLMSELAAFYDAFAYRPTAGEAPDHISVETAFIAYLRLKEAYALACSDAEHAAVTAEAAQRFRQDHLSALAEPLAVALRTSGVRYLALAGEALLRRVGPPGKALEKPRGDVLSCLQGCSFDGLDS